MAGPGGSSSTLTSFAKDLGPWTPDIDARRNDKPSIISGTNFVDTLDGPASAWSSDLVNYNFFTQNARQKISELKTATDILYGTIEGVWRINKVSGLMELLIPVTVDNLFWPWTIAFVGGVYYIAQYDVGLWQYDEDNNTLAHIATPSGDVVRYVAESYGRLLYLSDTYLAVSAQDDGADLTPSLTTAAQAQPISLVGGTAYKIEVIPDGFLVYTSNGIMRGTYTQAAYVFAYTVPKSRVRLFTPNGSVYIPKVGSVALDASGFSLTREYNYTDQGVSQPWEIPMGDYIKTNIVKFLDQTKFGTIQMYWSDAEQKLFVQFSSNTQEGIMITGFVWSFITKTWMSFDHQNTGVFETYSAINNQYTAGYMAIDGFMRVFSNTDFSEDLPPTPFTIQDFLYRTENEDPVMAEITNTMTGLIFQLGTTEILGSDNNPNAYKNFSTTSGLYDINSEVFSDTNNNIVEDPDMVFGPTVILGGTYINMDISGGVELYAIVYTLPPIGINSIITIGPYRFTDQVQADETSAVSTIFMGLTATASFIVTEDWNALVGDEDWNVEDGSEDWGSGNIVPNNFLLTLRSSEDGINAPMQGDEDLPVFNNLGSALTYAPFGYSGVFHTLTLAATTVGQSFAVKTVDFTGLLTGRLDGR